MNKLANWEHIDCGNSEGTGIQSIEDIQTTIRNIIKDKLGF